MDNNYKCVMCNNDIIEGKGQVCYNCQHINDSSINRLDLAELKKRIWHLIANEGITVTNQNLDWLLERAFKGMNK